MNSSAFAGPACGCSGSHQAQRLRIPPNAKARASTTQTTLQTAASLVVTACARRLKMPRSTTRTKKIMAWKPATIKTGAISIVAHFPRFPGLALVRPNGAALQAKTAVVGLRPITFATPRAPPNLVSDHRYPARSFPKQPHKQEPHGKAG